jgi:Flp pilus assembly protein TadD
LLSLYARAGEVASAVRPVTFNRDVAPLVFEHCAGCHCPGQAAPFGLLSYADAQKRAKQIAEVVGKRYMPPWLPERGQVAFAHDRSLSAEQIGVIEQWVAEGAVEGAAADLPPVPKRAEGWRLGTPDLVVKVPAPYTLSAEGKDVYHNLVVPVPITDRKYVNGIEFLPGNWKVIHHAFVEVDTTRVCRIRAAKANPPGFDGMFLPETATMPGGHFLSWQPGRVPRMGPSGMAWTLEPGTDLVLQLHMHPSGKPEPVQPAVGFYFTSTPPTNSFLRINLTALRIDIPPGVADYSVSDEYTLPVDAQLIGVGPHAHYVGKRVEGSARLLDGSRKQLLLIKDWDFNWQDEYRYSEPLFLPRGTTLTMRWTFDNSTNNVRNPNQPPKRVRHGSQTTDEMAELWFQVLPRDASDRAILERDFYSHLGNLALDYNEWLLKESPTNAEAHTKAGRAELYFGQVQQALDHFLSATRADPSYDKGWYELGYLYLRQKRWSEAQQAFENVIRLNPDDYEAEGSLGLLYLQKGDLAGAEAHCRAALRVNPDDKVAARLLERVLTAQGK